MPRLYDQIQALDPPDAIRERASLLLLDTLGICAASAPMEAGVIARDVAVRLYASADPKTQARMLFDGRTASLAGAGFAAATQIDNLDAHDGFNPVKGHIGVAVVPALVLLAQHLPDLSGVDALNALITGYEVGARAGIALHGSVKDFHTSGAWNALGVVAVAAQLRGTPANVFRQALGIAEYHGPRSQMMREIATPTMLHDGSGMGALVGLSAIVMAETGFTGAPAITVEDACHAPLWESLGRTWYTADQYIKPYPICRWAHAAIEAASNLRQTHGFDAADIASVRINTFASGVALFPGMPDTTSKAQYSLPFAVATMLARGHIGLGQISGAGLVDPAVSRLVDVTTCTTDDGYNAKFPLERWADVTVILKDGTKHCSAPTDADVFFDASAIEAKFMAFAAPALGETRAEAILLACRALRDPDARLLDLGALLTDPL